MFSESARHQSEDAIRYIPMELRTHPLMVYKRASNWPPVWTKVGGRKETADRFQAEAGVLLDVMWPHIEPHNRFHLIMEYGKAQYIGTLLFNDPSFCREIFKLFQGYCRQPIERLGSLDLSSLL